MLSGGSGSKQDVLDTVESAGLMALTERDRAMLRTRNEPTWRNDLAFVRSHLVEAGCIVNRRDSWEITPEGRQVAADLAMMAKSQGELRRLGPTALAAITTLFALPEIDDESAAARETIWLEGDRRQTWTITYERDRRLRDEAIRIHGLACKGCGFDFEQRYGALGKGFIEVHHLTPISEQGGPAAVDPHKDLTVLCSNCHSVVHRHRPKPLTLSDLVTLCDHQR